MSHPIRRELDLARLTERERRLRLVMQILSERQPESKRAGLSAPAGLRRSISDFGQQQRDAHHRQVELGRPGAAEARPTRAQRT